MGDTLTDAGRSELEAMARCHDVPTEAVATLLAAICRGGGRQAQFSHPALGGMGQWSRGGGIMIGDMFNHSLKARVEQLCNELAEHLDGNKLFAVETGGPGRDWWPGDLGRPSAVGSQNDEGYACFPQSRRLAIRSAGDVQLYDTGDHRISGVSQQQGSDRDLTFTSQHGTVRVSELRRVEEDPPGRHASVEPSEQSSPVRREGSPNPSAQRVDNDVIGLIERLHELQRNGVLTAEEFAAKKTELLARL